MSSTAYVIVIIALAVAFLIAGLITARRAFKKGMKAGTNQAVEWITVALAASGFQGDQLTKLLSTIAGHLQNFKNEIDKPDTKQEGGVTEN